MNTSDEMGKLAELLMAYELNPTVFHFRDEQKSPPIVLEILKDSLDPKLITNIRGHIEDSRSILMTKMVADGRAANTDDTASVYWSSNPNDHLMIVGVADKNSTADIIISNSVGHTGISMKVGKTRYPVLGNYAVTKISEYVSDFDVSDIFEEHRRTMVNIGLTGTQAENKEKLKSDKETSDLAHSSGDILLRGVSSRIHASLSSLSPTDLKDMAMDFIAPNTVIPHYLVYTLGWVSRRS
jgi:hypothetical protein